MRIVTETKLKIITAVSLLVAIVSCVVCISVVVSYREKNIKNGENAVADAASVSSSVAIGEDDYVFITANGKKYHREDCYTISKSKNVRKITREEAEDKGKEPCSVCWGE